METSHCTSWTESIFLNFFWNSPIWSFPFNRFCIRVYYVISLQKESVSIFPDGWHHYKILHSYWLLHICKGDLLNPIHISDVHHLLTQSVYYSSKHAHWELANTEIIIARCENNLPLTLQNFKHLGIILNKNLLVVCKVGLKTIILRDNVIRKHWWTTAYF